MVENIEVYGPLAVVMWMFLEEFIPVPSAVAPMAAGFVLIPANEPLQAFIMVFLFIAVVGSAASVLSSYLLYSIGFYGGKPVLERIGKYFRVSWPQIKAFETHFTSGREHLYLALFRAVPLIPLSVISASAGFFRIDWKTYGVWSFIGMIPRNLSLGMIGWYLRDDFVSAALLIGKLSTAAFIVLATAAFVYFFHNRKAFAERSKQMLTG